MQLVEKHIIDRSDPRYEAIDRAAFASKNLYNAALYVTRQTFIHQSVRIYYNALDKIMQPHEAYKALPAKVAQQVLKQVDKVWDGYIEAMKAWRRDPSKFTGRPSLPQYKNKSAGRNLLVYTIQAIGHGKKTLDRGLIKPSKLDITVKTKQNPKRINEVRIAPKKGFYVVEVVYEKDVKQAEVHQEYIAGIDLGVNNLIALASNKPGFVPVVVNGRPVKSINQFYNKRKASLQQKLGRTEATRRIERLTNKRNRRIEHYMHTISKHMIDVLIKEGIGVLCIGKNDGWKQNIEIGKRNNQTFCLIPHVQLIQMLTYKAELVGIKVIITEESYTSKASFLDRDELPVYNEKRKDKPTFSGKRIKRGLYRAADGRLINADINGASNIIRKVAPNAFGSRVVEECVVPPVRISLTK
ncbi:MAG TPA: transposase [Ktedonobacteraceae bacterium]|nr:transposase [Ktedonobacteraceae bacterium]